jgi:amino acid transporter
MSSVEQESKQLRKELGLTDLVLTQIMFVIGLSWVGTAGTLGTQQIPLWLAAMLVFYVPQAIVVIYLSRRFPLEGGLYQWTKLSLGPGMAFLVGWNLWIFAIILLGELGISISNGLIYAIGPTGQSLRGSSILIGATSGALLGVMVVLSILGLRTSKWIHNAGGGLLVIAFVVLISLPFVNLARGTLHEYHPLAMTIPALTLYNFNILGKLCGGALSGFEYVAVLAGETKNATRNIALSVVIAAPIIAVMFILGTSSVQAFSAPAEIDLIGPIPQTFRKGLGTLGIAAIAIPFIVMLPLARQIGQSSLLFTGTSRMPMVAGWDRLIPEWFSRLHARYRTPVNSILFIGATAFLFTLLGIFNVGEQEAFQVMQNAGGILYGLTYLVLFAVPLTRLASNGGRAPLWIRIAAVFGFAASALYVVLSVVPIIDVKDPLQFAVKVGGTVIVTNVIGVVLYRFRRRSGTVAAVPADPAR